MSRYVESSSSFAEIEAGKQQRREVLMRAVRLASPEQLDGPAERLREAMRKPAGSRKRERLGRPAFAQ